MRWLAFVVLAPILALGTFGGARFLAHNHDDHGMHWHPVVVGPLKGAELAAADHADLHGHDHSVPPSDCTEPSDGDEEPCEVPEGVIVSIDVHKRMPTRGTDLDRSMLPVVLFVIADFVMPPPPNLDRHIGSPGGDAGGCPLDLVALSARDRLVRTSRALLI